MIELVKRIRNRDREAEKELLDLLGDRISMLVHQRVGRAREDCQDIMQDAFLAVLQSLREGRFDPEKGTSLQSYVYGITTNKIRDYFKSQQRREFVREDLNQERDLAVQVDVELENTELRELLRTNLSKLKKKYRQVLFLRYYEELSISEISEQIGLPPRRVSERINYAIKLLKKECEKANIFSIFPLFILIWI